MRHKQSFEIDPEPMLQEYPREDNTPHIEVERSPLQEQRRQALIQEIITILEDDTS